MSFLPEAIVKEFSAVAANPKGQLKAYKDAGKKCIGVMPYYAPEELVYAIASILIFSRPP